MQQVIEDVIAAVATGVGGAVSIIRLSGPQAEQVASSLWKGSFNGKPLEQQAARQLVLGEFSLNGRMLDSSCLAVRMPGPHSYTGENVVEFHCHGGSVCTRAILSAVLQKGARLAEPGEFSKRAFLNGKMDLTQAEAVADMISAGSENALLLANRQLQGAIGRKVHQLEEEIQLVLAEVESRMDFPEEELDFLPPEELVAKLDSMLSNLEKLIATRTEGEILREGVSLVIAGVPNVGKSSLLNQILGQDRAIVSNIPGTTRDTIEAMAQIRGIPFRIMDTAGIRKGSSDLIEQAGMTRAQTFAQTADLVLWLCDATQPYAEQAWPEWKIQGKKLIVVNKCELQKPADFPENSLEISALTGQGLPALFDAMRSCVLKNDQTPQNEIAIASRHAELLLQAKESLDSTKPFIIAQEWEISAIQLRKALADIGKILGKTATPDILDTIFSRFCIGK